MKASMDRGLPHLLNNEFIITIANGNGNKAGMKLNNSQSVK